MRKVTPITEQFQHFVQEVKESFWGDMYGQTKLMWKRFWEGESARERDRYLGCGWHERGEEPGREYRNGFYWRSFETLFGTIRLRIARSRTQGFLPKRDRGLSAAGTGVSDADPGGVLTRDLDAAGRTSDCQLADRAGERADGVEADAEPGPGGKGFPPGAAER